MEKKQTLSSFVKETILMFQIFLTIFSISIIFALFFNNSEKYTLGYKIQEQQNQEVNLLKIKEEIQNEILKNSSINNLNNKLKIAKMVETRDIQFINGRYKRISQK